jgi:hypothetical protein
MSSGTAPGKRSKVSKTTSPSVAPVVVQVEGDAKGTAASLSNPGHGKVRVNPGGSITWHFTNTSKKAMEMGVGNFIPSPSYATNPRSWPHPLVKGALKVKVGAAGGTGTLKCKLRPHAELQFGNNPFITYKYDIVDGNGKVLLDPEIEIPNQAI